MVIKKLDNDDSGYFNLDRFAIRILAEESISSTVSKPYNLDDYPVWLAAKHISRQIDLLEFSEAMLSPDSIIFRGFKISSESIYGEIGNQYLGFFNRFNFFRRNYLKYKTIKVDKALVITDPWSLINYYHWTIQALPRLSVAATKEDVVLILPYSKYRVSDDVIFSTLNAFGFKKNRVIWLEKNQKVKAKKILMPTNSGESNHSFKMIKRVSESIKSFYHNHLTFDLGKKIYISRSKACSRRFVNEKDVVNLLSKNGYVSVNMEEYSFLQQVSLMSNAQYVVSCHGAGLSNIIFMKKDGFVLELISEIMMRSHFYYAAAASGLNYLQQKCKNSDKKYGDNSDIVVDINALEKNLKLMS